MKDVEFVSYEGFEKILSRMTCPCCMGVRLMPTEEELEQHITGIIDGEDIRKAILSLDLKQMNEAIKQGKAVVTIER